MSEFGVYGDEMLKRFSDQEIDRLLSGKTPESEELARLVPILRALHEQTVILSEDRVAGFAAEAAELARATKRGPAAISERTMTPPRRLVLALRKKLATVLTAALLLSTLTGVGLASNDAAPGDPLFGVDQLLEEIGIGDGEAAERIAEAQALFKGGHVAEAIAHAAEAVEVTEGDVEVFSPETSNASTALEDAAIRVAGGDDANSQSQDVRDRVALMLEEMALMMGSPDFDGEAFGVAVADMARDIGGAPDELPAAADAASRADEAENGPDTAEEASEDAEGGLDTAEEAQDNQGNDIADEATGGERPGRP